ncbi:hypothetical protein Nepgr_031806 [Nepenthes gracilis]|uniref:Uncharacterized protein n=1 Tax=Nepenthes gracilis TaxID=150966 RepID=A0AAD3TJC5_NEPGR|nr:hypothetical protein Nepgr_031806 [Nepenthes gracilis]
MCIPKEGARILSLSAENLSGYRIQKESNQSNDRYYHKGSMPERAAIPANTRIKSFYTRKASQYNGYRRPWSSHSKARSHFDCKSLIEKKLSRFRHSRTLSLSLCYHVPRVYNT